MLAKLFSNKTIISSTAGQKINILKFPTIDNNKSAIEKITKYDFLNFLLIWKTIIPVKNNCRQLIKSLWESDGPMTNLLYMTIAIKNINVMYKFIFTVGPLI